MLIDACWEGFTNHSFIIVTHDISDEFVYLFIILVYLGQVAVCIFIVLNNKNQNY